MAPRSLADRNVKILLALILQISTMYLAFKFAKMKQLWNTEYRSLTSEGVSEVKSAAETEIRVSGLWSVTPSLR